MLSIFLSVMRMRCEALMYNFGNHYDKAWPDDPFVREIIRTVDASELQDGRAHCRRFWSRFLWSGWAGCKRLVLICKEENFEYRSEDLVVAGELADAYMTPVQKLRPPRVFA